MSKPTIKDVSRLAGVSIGTVSNVVNGRPNISKRMLDRVNTAIDMLGYKPNRAAKSMRGRTRLLGYRMPEVSTTVNTAMDVFLHAVAESAGEEDFELLLFTPKPGQSELDAYQDVLKRGGVDAFIIAGVEYDDERIEFLEAHNMPFAAFGRVAPAKERVVVDIDGAAGTRVAVQHLIANDRQRCAFVGWPEGSLTGDERFRGWREGLQRAGLTPNEHPVFRAEDSFANGADLVPKLLGAGADCAVCVSDMFALGIMAGMRRAGLTPGQEIAVVGFDNTAAAGLIEPGLSSIHQPMAEVGQILVARLAQLLDTESSDTDVLLIPPILVARGSTEC